VRTFEREAGGLAPVRAECGRRRRRRGEPPRRRAPAPEPDPALAGDPLAEARLRARDKARFARDLVQFTLIVGLLWWVMRPAAFVIGVLWGLKLAKQFGRRIVEPALSQRWVEHEVRRQLHREVPERRRQLEGQHARRMEEIAAGVAHEIRNPITAAKSLVQQMGEDPASGENVEYAKVALEELNRVERSISHLLRYAREEELRLAELRLADVIASALETFRDRLAHAGVQVETRVEGACRLRGDAEKLRRVVINLVGNALDALEEARPGAPRIDVEAGESLAGSEVWLRVSDNGPGIEPARLERIWSPFYTSKEAGTGLGLALARKVVDAHGGSIEATSQPGRGTRFLVVLPRSGRAVPEEAT
jgi:signal transduction histidine kinase